MAKFNGTWEEVVSMEKDIYCFGRTQDGHLFFANGSDIYIVGGQTVLHSQVFI